FFSMKKHGWIALSLIILAIISITPPVDSFSVSRANQITLLKNTLIENDMLEDGEIVPNEDVSEKDQTTITMTVSYLNQLDYKQDIPWLHESISQPYEFEVHVVYEDDAYDTTYK